MRLPLARTIITLLLLHLAFLTLAQVQIVFTDKAKRKIWIGGLSDRSVPDTAVSSDQREVLLGTGVVDESDHVYVLDLTTGNLALRKLAEIDKVWKPTTVSFKWIGELQVEVTHKGKPAASAQVTLKNKSWSADSLLTPSDQGVVKFFGVPAGDLTLSLDTKFQGKAVQIPTQSLNIPLERDSPLASFPVAVAQTIDTVERTSKESSSNNAAASQTSTPQDNGSFIGRIFTLLMGVAIAVGVGYALIRFVQRKPEVIDDQLAKLGVQIPKDQDADDGPDPGVPDLSQMAAANKVQRVEPIVLSDAAPTSTVSPIQQNSQAFSRTLRTVDGTPLDLSTGTHSVGRDTGGIWTALSHPSVSRQHFEISLTNGEVVLTDLGSTNGTFVNGEKLEPHSPRILNTGDKVQIGTVGFRLE